MDFILGILLLYGIVRGIWNGFFAEVASILSLVIGIFTAIKFSGLMRNVLSGIVAWDPQNIRIVAFVLTFILVVVGISILARLFTTVANFAGLGLFNKLMGGFVGLLKMALIISVVLNVFERLNSTEALADKSTIENSTLYNLIRKIAAAIYPTLTWIKT